MRVQNFHAFLTRCTRIFSNLVTLAAKVVSIVDSLEKTNWFLSFHNDHTSTPNNFTKCVVFDTLKDKMYGIVHLRLSYVTWEWYNDPFLWATIMFFYDKKFGMRYTVTVQDRRFVRLKKCLQKYLYIYLPLSMNVNEYLWTW